MATGARGARAGAALVLLLTACTAGAEPSAITTSPATAPSPAIPPADTASAVPEPEPHPVSLPALMNERPDGHGLRIVRTVATTSAHRAHLIRYRGDGLGLTGLLLVPRGEGPFPVLVLNHGYIDPAVYRTGRGFERTQVALVRRGFAVLHIDYRNHAGSDRDPSNDERLRLGYALDAINAVRAVRRSDLPALDRERVGMLGRSMGGEVTFRALVIAPGIVDAAAVFASTSTDAVDNFNKWIRPRTDLAERILDRYGTPRRAPGFWDGVSPRTFFDRIQVPVLVHHGTEDDTCPIAWADATVDALRHADVDVTYHRYPGAGHQLYGADYERSIGRTVAFFRAHLR